MASPLPSGINPPHVPITQPRFAGSVYWASRLGAVKVRAIKPIPSMARPINRLATELPVRLMALPIQVMIRAAIKMRLVPAPRTMPPINTPATTMIRVKIDANRPICDRLRPKLVDNSVIEGANFAILMPFKLPQNKIVIVNRKSRAKDEDGIAMICLKSLLVWHYLRWLITANNRSSFLPEIGQGSKRIPIKPIAKSGCHCHFITPPSYSAGNRPPAR